MKRLPKDLADKMVMDVLISISKLDNVPVSFAKDSLDIMDNPIDNSVITGVLLTKARPSLFNEKEIDMKSIVASALQTVFVFGKENNIEDGFDNDVWKEFSVDDEDKCLNSTKLNFALNQFVNAFYEYERLEEKYPELMKFM
jgi:hypothetical protein